MREGGATRRDFLKGTGALVVAFGAPCVVGGAGAAGAEVAGVPGDELESWIAVTEDGRVMAWTGKCELGQGIFTAQTQLVAEELQVPFDRVTLVQCDTDRTPDQGTTSGARSHPENFNQSNLALAAATAREALVGLASDKLGVAAAGLEVVDGVVRARGDATRAISYGSLIGGRRLNLKLDGKARRRSPREWTVMGRPVPRLDLPAMITGRFEYVHNVRLPGMLHGQVVRPPAVGARLAAVDEASVRDAPGLVKVVVRKDFVGVVATKPWQAQQAAARLRVSWTKGVGLPPMPEVHEYLRHQKPSRDALLVDSGDVEARLRGAVATFRATYRHPYQMHGSLGSSCAVADVQKEKATIYSATQAVHPHRHTAAILLGLRPENVRVIYRMGSGCYGLNGAEAVSYDAALLSQAVGRPVRVQLTRKAEMAWENYGLAFVVDQQAGLDADGNVVAWDCESWAPSRGSRPGMERPGNVVTGFLAGFEPAPLTARAATAPTSFENGSNGIPSYLAGSVGGHAQGTGTVRSERVLTHTVPSPFFTGPLRSPQRLQNTFAHECFMDELAHRAQADPVAYRLRHLADPRLRHVLSAAAEKSGWTTRPSPAKATGGPSTGRGVACVHYEGDNGYCAMVAEVTVDEASGEVNVKRLVAALDCGPVSNPDGLRNQIEGGALQGTSRALGEEVAWDDERVTSVDWASYKSLTLGFEAPVVESVLVDKKDAEAAGAGETAITVVGAAIGNAIFDATGARLRQMPFTAQRVKEALQARQPQTSRKG